MYFYIAGCAENFERRKGFPKKLGYTCEVACGSIDPRCLNNTIRNVTGCYCEPGLYLQMVDVVETCVEVC